MEKTGAVYTWPMNEDYSLEPRAAVICPMGFPELVNSRGHFRFTKESLSDAEIKALARKKVKRVVFK
jgi:hypothetical protein